MERVTLEVEARAAGKSSAARALRRAGKIPGVLYGNGREPASIAVDARVLREALAGESGRHAILHVTLPGADGTPAILKDFQVDPVRNRMTHFDLLAVRMDQEIQAVTEVLLVGEPDGVRNAGGVLDQPTHQLNVQALPDRLPGHVDVDVTALGLGDSIRVGDLTPPEGVVFLDDPDLVLASVTGSSPVEAEVEPGAEEGEGEGEAAAEGGAAAEPQAE